MKIDNVNTLLEFLRENWTKIPDNDYIQIMRESLQVYEWGKRESYEITEQLILKYVDFVSSNPPHYEKPIFLELNLDVE